MYDSTQIHVDELQCDLTVVNHPSGARIVHIGNDDPENLFCLAFRTLPTRSDGVAHILEHTVLCGSKKFPVKDPFFCMTRRSLNTFMNAMTGEDMTFYPAASQVKKDFYNLLDVYCDAVFEPNLDEQSFRQEGHRLEVDENGKLVFKGIVFNEMKGAMASPDARAWERMSELLFPDTPYKFNSGGDPAVIPELTYEELRDFHKTYYHPSRCVFFFYGNMPLEDHVAFLEEHVLKGITPQPPLPAIPHQPRFSKGVRETGRYPLAPDESPEEKATAIFGYLTCTAKDQLEILALGVLDIVLMGSDASPLKLALLKSGLCKEAYSGLDTDTLDVPFLFLLKGCREDEADALEKCLMETLRQIAEEGIDQNVIDGAIHQMEIDRLEITGDANPFGLTLFRRTVPLMMHGGVPEEGLMIHSLFAKLRETFSVKGLIEKNFLQNPHFVRLIMSGDPDMAQEEVAKERQTLDAMQVDKQKIVQAAEELAAFQEKQEEADLEVLPKVTLKDVPKEIVDFPLTEEAPVYSHPCFTNDLVYASMVFDMPQVAMEDLPYVRLLMSLLPEMGCGGRDYKQTLDYEQEHTGGVDATLGLHPQANDFTHFRPALSVGGKALGRKVDKLFPFLRDMITSSDLTDQERLAELLMQHHSSLENSLNHNALKYAINLAGSGLTPGAYIGNLWYGLDYLYVIRELMDNLNLPALIEKLQRLQEEVLCRGNASLILACDEKQKAHLEKEQFYGALDLPSKPLVKWKGVGQLPTVSSQGRIIASPVSFTCQMMRGVCYADPDSPALSLASRLFNHQTLHPQIREQGGAYGAGAANNATGGSFYFFCYRDPHLKSSLDAIQTAIQKVAEGDISPRNLEEAKLTVLQKLDTPVSPGTRAELSYARLRDNRSVELRQQVRDRLLSLTAPEIADAVRRHLLPQLQATTTVSFASDEFLERENAQLDTPLQILPV